MGAETKNSENFFFFDGSFVLCRLKSMNLQIRDFLLTLPIEVWYVFFCPKKQYATSILSQCKRRIWSTSESSLLIDTHKWIICVDLKLVKFRLGQQSGYTKFPCFLCLWDSIVGTGFPTPLFYESPYTTILLTI